MSDSRSAAAPSVTASGDGVSVPRRFTEAGEHPFDCVEWEIRDAVIGDPENPAFEQRGVEFPVSWSQNATNIVAQKYFRGRLDTPERETSVKQMVGRVAGTIAGWGREGGYFASDDDAQAFEDELTHILLHQMAAFNSPVWFNVGFEESPQCSACFILSVEDTIESILDWNTKEGMIFRGGSGSGINLSRIRASSEHLSKGGLASGPVSFMRGADAWAGTIKSGGKCFKEGTLVSTPGGWQPIERLRVGDDVLTHKGPRAIADFMPNGRKQCYRVLTREGYEVEVTEGHKFAYWNDVEGGFDVKPIEAFEPGDSLYALLEPSNGGTAIPFLPPEIADPAHATTTVEMQLPTELDEQLSYVIGLTYGDGDLRTSYPYRLRVSFCKDAAGRVSADRFRDYCRRLFGEEPLLLGDEQGHQQLGFTRKRLIEFLTVNGIAKGKGDTLGFPSMLFRAERHVRAAFIAGVIDADGCYQRRGGWAVSSIDRAFLVNLQRLLLTLGVPSKIKLSREARGTWRPLYRLSIVGHTFVERLVEHIAPHSAKAEVLYEPSAGADKGWGYRPSLYGALTSRVRERGSYRLVERRVGMNETSGYGAVVTLASHPEAAVANYAKEVSTCVPLMLESVTPTEIAETYDIEVEDVHLLSANGIYSSNTRRAAKMVVLDVDHPDILDFIWCKAREEEKALALRDAGFDMRLDSEAFASIQYQNANNSVRVTDEFMERAERGEEWELTARVDGSVVDRVDARELLKQLADAAWRCADPGVQYDTTINEWHTCPNSGRINASNPCFPGDARVHTTLGLLPFEELYERAQGGEDFRVYTHRATADEPGDGVVATRPPAVMRNGVKPIFRLRFANGQELRCTPNHRLWTVNRGYVRAEDLTAQDRVLLNDSPTPAEDASWALPVRVEALAKSFSRGGHVTYQELPEAWSEGLGELTGHLIGDGDLTDARTEWIYGGDDIDDGLASSHEGMLRELIGGVSRQEMANGTVQLRAGSEAVREFFRGLGVHSTRAHGKRIPRAVFTAPPEVQAAFLRGLFGADGCVSRVESGKANRYVGLGSRSTALLRDVQRLLSGFGVRGRIYRISERAGPSFSYTRVDGTTVQYESRQGYDLRITGSDLERFAESIGFSTPRKEAALAALLSETGRYRTKLGTGLVARDDDGQEVVYNLTEPLHHSYIVDGFVVANCSEYMHVDDSACNLASLNLMKFRRADGSFDVESFEHTVDVMILAQEIVVSPSSYPTEEIGCNARAFRQLGMGYANLGALLMANGVAYNSDEGRALCGAITALMTGRAYRTSAEVAGAIGPYERFEENRDPHLHVMGKHRHAAYEIDDSLSTDAELLTAARRSWDEAIDIGTVNGYRNAQATVLAPTGTISFLMDCDTTGIEPDFSLVKFKELVGGGLMTIVNRTVPLALQTLGYSEHEIEQIEAHLADNATIVGAPGLRDEHLPVFDVAVGERAIAPMGHIKMMAAAQPFLSGAISKTVNLPESVSVEDIAGVYSDGWKLGLKALAIYRDGSKTAQALKTDAGEKKDEPAAIEAIAVEPARPTRRRMPRERQSLTHKFSVGGHEGYITAGEYEDGSLGEVFLTDVGKEGSTIKGLMNAFATAISIGLQYGVPLETLVRKFAYMRFEPEGYTGNPEIPFAKSMPDYIMRWLASRYGDADLHEELGILTAEVRARKASQEALMRGDTAGPPAPSVDAQADADPEPANGTNGQANGGTGSGGAGNPKPAASALTDEPPAVPAKLHGLDLGPACAQCGGMMQRTGSCYTCSSCGNNTGCG